MAEGVGAALVVVAFEEIPAGISAVDGFGSCPVVVEFGFDIGLEYLVEVRAFERSKGGISQVKDTPTFLRIL